MLLSAELCGLECRDGTNNDASVWNSSENTKASSFCRCHGCAKCGWESWAPVDLKTPRKMHAFFLDRTSKNAQISDYYFMRKCQVKTTTQCYVKNEQYFDVI